MIRLTRTQVREIDRRATEEYHIPAIVLMENAAREATDVASEMLHPGRASVLILCGGGNNGGDGLAIARHLHNRGHKVRVGLTIDPKHYSGEALINWKIVEAMRLPWFRVPHEEVPEPQLIIDAIFGTGLNRPPREPFGVIVEAVGKLGAPVLAIDLPSGLDCDIGVPLGPCIHATRTVTFVAEKMGFGRLSARQYTGEVTVVDIGCPSELIEAVIRDMPRSPP